MLDAPVLARGGLTAFLLSLAEAGAFDPVWSEQIHAEWTKLVHSSRPDIPIERLRHRRVEMDRAFPVANVVASRDAQDEVIAHCVTPNERKAAHVLATALSARAAVIVSDASFCLRGVMAKLWHDTAVMTHDALCQDLLDRRPREVLAGARMHRAAQTRGDNSVDAWLNALRGPRMDLAGTADRLAPLRDSL